MDDGRALSDDIGRTAGADNRPAEDEVRDAMALYALLPPAARRSLQAQVSLARSEQQAALGQAVGHLIVQHGFDLFRALGAEWAVRAYPEGTLATEEEIIEEAVRITREARARTARS